MTVALRSRATRWAILFSNPSSAVGEGHVVRVGADAQVRGRPLLRAGHEYDGGGGEERHREPTPYGMHACSRRNRQKVKRWPSTTPGAGARSLRHRVLDASAYCDWCCPSTAYNPNTSSVPPALLML